MNHCVSLNGVWDFYPDYDEESNWIVYDSGCREHSEIIGQSESCVGGIQAKIFLNLPENARVRYSKLVAQLHVGSRLVRLAGETACLLKAKINGGKWMVVELHPFMDDGVHWIEIPVNVEDLVPGHNVVMLTSTIANKGSYTPETIDLIASAADSPSNRSFYNKDGNWEMFIDRMWNIRLWYASLDTAQWQHITVPAVWEGNFAGTKTSLSKTVETELRIKVNDGEWKTLKLDPYKDDQVHWLEIPIDTCDLQFGDNEIVVDSSVANYGNVIKESLDLYGSANAPAGRSYFSNNLKTWRELPDRNWNIRLLVKRLNCDHWEELGHDDGTEAFNTVIGLYVPNGSLFYLKTVISVDKAEQIVEASIKVHVHVGSLLSMLSEDYSNTYKYDGVGWYRRNLSTPSIGEKEIVWLYFGAADYLAEVWVNGIFVGSHEGGYTPFRMDITTYVDALKHEGDDELIVRVTDQFDPRFGTGCRTFPVKETLAGFLQDSAGINYGGLWQDVKMQATSALYIEETFLCPDIDHKLVTVRIKLRNKGSGPAMTRIHVHAVSREDGTFAGEGFQEVKADSGEACKVKLDIGILDPHLWSIHNPHLYTATISIIQEDSIIDTHIVDFGMRKVEVVGSKIFFNNSPVLLTGMLHWGWYWEAIAEKPTPEQVRKEITDLKRAGVNAIKFCLFDPPCYVLDEMDRMGMYAYIEYPIWNPIETPAFFERAPRHIREMLIKDRNHPCLIMTDFNCEMHNFSEEMNTLMMELVDMGRKLAPNRLYLDNSSNGETRYGDFYACHPYNELNKFRDVIDSWALLRAEASDKPLVLGEYAHTDTIRDTGAVREANAGQLPWWWSMFRVADPEEIIPGQGYSHQQVERFKFTSRQYALMAKKYYIESSKFNDRVTAMFITHLVDVPATQPGFYDDNFIPKFDPDELRKFAAESVLLLERRTQNYWCGAQVEVTPFVSHYDASPIPNAKIYWELSDGAHILVSGAGSDNAFIMNGTVTKLEPIIFQMPWCGHPSKLKLMVSLVEKDGKRRLQNDWWLWAYPGRLLNQEDIKGKSIGVLDPDNRLSFRSGYAWVEDSLESRPDVLVSTIWNEEVLRYVAEGGLLIHIGHEGGVYPVKQGGFGLFSYAVIPNPHPALGDFPHDGYGDQQFLELATPYYLYSEGQPIIARLELRSYEMGAYLAERRVGEGRVLQTTLRLDSNAMIHDPDIRSMGALHHEAYDNVAGRYLLDQLLRYLISME